MMDVSIIYTTTNDVFHINLRVIQIFTMLKYIIILLICIQYVMKLIGGIFTINADSEINSKQLNFVIFSIVTLKAYTEIVY